MRNSIIVLLVVALGWSGWRLAEVERQRYALVTSLCQIDPANPRTVDCLRTAEPRSSRLWNFYYGLFD